VNDLRSNVIDRVQIWISRISPGAILLSSSLALVVIGIGDYITGVEIIFTMFYLIPVSAISWKLGRTAGIVASLVCAITWSIVDYFGRPLFDPLTEIWNNAIQFAMFVSYAVVVSRVRTGIDQQRIVNAKLRDALAEVKRLSGVLPICAWCKKIRDGEGNWHMLEAFIVEHSEADFTHSICPECKGKFFPGRNHTHSHP
jgi:hypothetical protein